MVRILVIDNAPLNNKGGIALTNAMNGKFALDLKTAGALVTYCHFLVDNKTSINDFDLAGNGIDVLPLPFNKNKILRYVIAYITLIRNLKRFDFVYFYYPSSFKHLTFLCKFFHVRFGVYIRQQKKLNDGVSHWIYRNATVVMTVSDYFTNMVNHIAKRIVAKTIRPMIPYSYEDIVLDRYYEKKESYSILYLGRIDEEKGLRELIYAISYLKNVFNFKLDIVGNGAFLPELKKLIESLELKDIVFLKGAVYDFEEKKQYYVSSDLYIIPTYHEGFPRTLYEAMIFGTPVITTLVGGIPALMTNKVNCLEIEPKSVDSIRDSIRYAFENYDKMGELARNGSELMKRVIAKDRLSHGCSLFNIINTKG